MDGQAVSNIYFGLNPMWVSTCVLVVTYAVIITEKVNRSIVALIGAALMVVVGVLDQEEAIAGVDWNTIGLLTGMMILCRSPAVRECSNTWRSGRRRRRARIPLVSS